MQCSDKKWQRALSFYHLYCCLDQLGIVRPLLVQGEEYRHKDCVVMNIEKIVRLGAG